MKWDESFASFHKVDQSLFLVRCDLGCIGIDDKPIVARKQLLVQGVSPIRVSHLDATLGQDGLQLAEAIHRLVVPVIAEEKKLDRLGVVRWRGLNPENRNYDRGS